MASDHLADFFNYLTIEKGLATNTVTAYKSDLERFFHYISINNLSLEQIKSDDLTMYVAWLRGTRNVEFRLG